MTIFSTEDYSETWNFNHQNFVFIFTYVIMEQNHMLDVPQMLNAPMYRNTMLSQLTVFANTAPRHKDVHFLHHIYYMDEHKSVQCH